MAVEDKATIKTYFETGDTPTETQFGNLIDSYQDIDQSLTALVSAANSGTPPFVVKWTSASAADGIALGTFAEEWISVDATASALDQIGGGTAGIGVFVAVTTAAARDAIGLSTVTSAAAKAGTETITRAWTAERVADAVGALSNVHGQCKLIYTNTTTLTLSKYNGDKLIIDDTVRTITTEPTITTSGLSATTIYRVYAYWSGTDVELELSTTAQAVSSTGIVIKTGDNTRTLVGMIRTTASTQFADAATARFTRSWFNDGGVVMNRERASATTSTSTSFAEDTGTRVECIVWSEDNCTATIAAGCLNPNNTNAFVAIAVNGTVYDGTEFGGAGIGTLTWPVNVTYGETFAADGFVTFNPALKVASGTMTFGRTDALPNIAVRIARR